MVLGGGIQGKSTGFKDGRLDRPGDQHFEPRLILPFGPREFQAAGTEALHQR